MREWLARIGVAVLLALPVAASADPARDMSAISAQLQSPQVLRASFRQVRTAKALRRPIVSTGQLVVAAQKGVLWSAETPFASRLAITPTHIVEQLDGGKPRTMSLSAQPGFQVLMQAFMDLPAGRFQPIERNFTTSVKQAAEGWELQLVPRDKALQAAIINIRVRGRAFIEEVRIEERGGDATTITFTGHRADTAGLTPAELKQLRG